MEGRINRIRELIALHPEYITFNKHRSAVQIVDCTGEGILLSVPVFRSVAVALAE